MPRTAASLVSEALAAWILSRLEHEKRFRTGGASGVRYSVPAESAVGGRSAGRRVLVGARGVRHDGRGAACDSGSERSWGAGWPNAGSSRRHRMAQRSRAAPEDRRGSRAATIRASTVCASSPAPLRESLRPFCSGGRKNASEFTATPQHRLLLETLREAPGLRSVRSLEGVAAFLAEWSEVGDGAIGRPRDVLPALGLLRDPRLFEAEDLAKRLEHNLRVGERVTIMPPGDVRQRRERATRYRSAATAERVSGALDRLEGLSTRPSRCRSDPGGCRASRNPAPRQAGPSPPGAGRPGR